MSRYERQKRNTPNVPAEVGLSTGPTPRFVTVLKALAWTTATVTAVGLTAWLAWLFLSRPTVTVYTSPFGSSATCYSLAAVAAGKDDGDDAYDAGYITNGLAATAQAINTACDEKRIRKLTLVGLIAAPTIVIDFALGDAVRRRRGQRYP